MPPECQALPELHGVSAQNTLPFKLLPLFHDILGNDGTERTLRHKFNSKVDTEFPLLTNYRDGNTVSTHKCACAFLSNPSPCCVGVSTGLNYISGSNS